MIALMKSQLYKNKKILKYLCCSVVAALFEIVLGWLLLKHLLSQIVVVNTITIIMGAILHYFLTLLFVFEKENSYKNILIYAISFVLGIFIQDGIIWLFYNEILTRNNEMIRYSVSKGLSLVIPFFGLYYIRSILYEKLNNRLIKIVVLKETESSNKAIL